MNLQMMSLGHEKLHILYCSVRGVVMTFHFVLVFFESVCNHEGSVTEENTLDSGGTRKQSQRLRRSGGETPRKFLLPRLLLWL